MSDNPTLETLESKLQRLIEEWKTVQIDPLEQKPGIDANIYTSYRLAEFVALHPELLRTAPATLPDAYTPAGLEGALIPQLLALPDEIRRLQESFDAIDLEYQQAIAIGGINSLGKSHFAGKDGTYHSAANDIERKLALDMVPTETDELIEQTKKRADALRALQQARNRLECARLIIQMVCRGNGK